MGVKFLLVDAPKDDGYCADGTKPNTGRGPSLCVSQRFRSWSADLMYAFDSLEIGAAHDQIDIHWLSGAWAIFIWASRIARAYVLLSRRATPVNFMRSSDRTKNRRLRP